jgi:hypothetical protein
MVWLCHWCHEPVRHDTPYRASDPTLDTPTGRLVCAPNCHARPDDARSFQVWGRGAS